MRFAVFAMAVLIGCAAGKSSTSAATAPASGDPLKVPEGNALIVSLQARGAQVYGCKDGTKWELKAPDAQLMDASGAVVGKHYGGPTWESQDGSKVMGEVVAKVPSPGTIPQLLLKAKSTEGSGTFSKVAFIQRLDTKGGAAPDGACTTGAEQRVDYTATYSFYGAK
jgi:Protein of unknown function (DUF3455)